MSPVWKFAVSCLVVVALLVSGGALQSAHACAGLHGEGMASAAHIMDAAAVPSENCAKNMSSISPDPDRMATHCCQSVACNAGIYVAPVWMLTSGHMSLVLTIRPAALSSDDLWTATPPYQPPRFTV